MILARLIHRCRRIWLALAALIAIGGAADSDSRRETGRHRHQPPADWSDQDEEYSGGRVGGWYQKGYYDEGCECWREGRWRD